MNQILKKEHIPSAIRRICLKRDYDIVSEWGVYRGFTVYSLGKSSLRNAVIGLTPSPVILYKWGIAIPVIFRRRFLFRNIKRTKSGAAFIKQWPFAIENGFNVIHHVKTIGKFDYYSMYKSKKADRRGKRSRLYATIENGVPRLLTETESKVILDY